MDKVIERDVIREDILVKMKESYHQGDVVMSEFLRGQDDLSVAEKKELLLYAGDDEYVVLLQHGEIVSKEDVYEGLVTGLNMIVEALGYDVEGSGFGYSDEGLACVSGGDMDSFEEGFDWIVDELSGGYGSGPEGLQAVEGLNLALKSLGFMPENGSEFVFEGIDKIYYMDNGNKTSMDDGLEALKMNLFEVGLLELTSDTISFAVEGNRYLVGWEKEFPDMLSFFDIEGDCSIMGSKEALIEELKSIKIGEAVIQEFGKQADVLLKRHVSKESVPEHPGLEEQISKAHEKCDKNNTGRDVFGDKELYR